MDKRGGLFGGIVALCLLIGVNAVAESLGELGGIQTFSKGFAITADRGGSETLCKNPASLALTGPEVTTGYASWFDSSYAVASLSGGMPLDEHFQIGFSLPVKFISDIPETIEENGQAKQLGSFSDIESEASLAVQYTPFEGLHTGVKVDYFIHTLNTDSASGMGFGAGIIYDYQAFTVGASVLNMGNTKMAWKHHAAEVLLQEVNLGLTYKGDYGVKVLADMTLVGHENNRINLGVEWQIIPEFTVNGGLMDVSETPLLTLGTALKMQGVTFLYAFAQHPELGSIHKIGITLQ